MSIYWFPLLIGLILAIGIAGKPVSTGDDNDDERINYLLSKTELSKSWDEFIDSFVSDDKNLSKYVPILKSFLNRFLPYEKLRPQLVKIYREFYTKLDINKMIRFFDSPIGKKMLENEDSISNRLGEFIQAEFSENTDEFRDWATETFANDESGAFTKVMRAAYILFT